jgi:peptidoglycan hydrolase CwlO-like protein
MSKRKRALYYCLSAFIALAGCGNKMQCSDRKTEAICTESVSSSSDTASNGHRDLRMALGVEWDDYILERLKKIKSVEYSIPEDEIRNINELQINIQKDFSRLKELVTKCNESRYIDCDIEDVKMLKRNIDKYEKEIQVILEKHLQSVTP